MLCLLLRAVILPFLKSAADKEIAYVFITILMLAHGVQCMSDGGSIRVLALPGERGHLLVEGRFTGQLPSPVLIGLTSDWDARLFCVGQRMLTRVHLEGALLT